MLVETLCPKGPYWGIPPPTTIQWSAAIWATVPVGNNCRLLNFECTVGDRGRVWIDLFSKVTPFEDSVSTNLSPIVGIYLISLLIQLSLLKLHHTSTKIKKASSLTLTKDVAIEMQGVTTSCMQRSWLTKLQTKKRSNKEI